MSQTKRFLSLDDLTCLPAPAWMIEGLFEANSLVMLAGPPASYKSFLALDWILSMGSGRKWMNRPTKSAKILYVLGEGKASLLKRIDTWCCYNQLNSDEKECLNQNFRVSFDVPQMASKSSVDNMLAGLAEAKYEPGVIVVDTFARSFVGLDENSQKDTGLWIESADRLRQLGYTVIFLHHTAKNTEFGIKYRGSSAIMGAIDTAMTLSRDGQQSRVKLDVTKQKDHDEGDPLYFNRLIVRAHANEEGSIVLVPAAPPRDERFSEEGNRMELAIKQMIADDGTPVVWEKARKLNEMFPTTSASAFQARIGRRLKKRDEPLDIGVFEEETTDAMRQL